MKGFTLVEVLIGTFLMLLVFLGIFGGFHLALRVVIQSRAKITATALANQQMEMIRNLSYSAAGTQGATLPYAEGNLEPATTTEVNGIEYTIETKVKFISDEADGTGAEDPCDLDYKRAQVKVSWPGKATNQVQLSTDLAPKDKAEEISACTAQPGGILSVRVFDAFGTMVDSPLIEVFDPETGNLVDSVTPSSGEYDFPLATSTYKVVVSKPGYSSDQSYGAGETYNGKTIATPEKPNPIVLENEVTEISFSIDKVSAFSVDTLSPWGTDYFSDTFSDTSKISQSSNVVVGGGQVNLATSTEGYLPSGFLISTPVSPSEITSWDSFTFTDSEPGGTDLKYQLYYASGTDWFLIPDTDLPGNAIGFDSSPVDLSGLNTSHYSQLKLRANFSTESTTTTPTLEDWQVSWITSIPTPIPNVTFKLEGAKTVGQDANENPIYKYSTTNESDDGGHINISNLEWDAYTFSLDPATGLDLVETNPSPQPIDLDPDTSLGVALYLEAENSLLITIEDAQTLEPVFGAAARLYNSGLNYDKTQETDNEGKTYFIPLEPALYNLEISAPGYTNFATTTSVSGDETKTIKLERIE